MEDDGQVNLGKNKQNLFCIVNFSGSLMKPMNTSLDQQLMCIIKYTDL